MPQSLTSRITRVPARRPVPSRSCNCQIWLRQDLMTKVENAVTNCKVSEMKAMILLSREMQQGYYNAVAWLQQMFIDNWKHPQRMQECRANKVKGILSESGL
jgi:hypothetical protein